MSTLLSFQIGWAQKKVSSRAIPILDSSTAYIFDWQVKRIGFFGQKDGLQLLLAPGGQRIYFLISAAGGIISFADSIQNTPIPLEKRNAYSFHEWTEGEKFRVLVCRNTDTSGWLRCQWKKIPSGEIIDEIWLCAGEADCQVNWIEWKSIGQVLIQKM